MRSGYYHGGVAGLHVGDSILPPSRTGAVSMADLADAPKEMRDQLAKVHSRDLVYLTTDPAAARLFAGLHPDGDEHRGGDVYRVIPEQPVTPDPDYLHGDGASVCAPSAVIVAVVARRILRAPYLPLIEGEVSR